MECQGRSWPSLADMKVGNCVQMDTTIFSN